MKKVAFIFIIIFLAATMLIAQESEDSFTSSGNLTLQLSTLPEAKLGYTHTFVFPFMQGESPLTQDNNIRLALTGEISPISLNGVVEAVWTPIAFIEIVTGGRIGSGWNIELFGSDIYGIGFNERDDHSADGSAFDGLLWKWKLGGAFQFDLAAIIPGEWNHVVFRTYHEINYNAYSRATNDQPWYFEAGDGEFRNAFNYYGNFLIGYQMPIFLNLVGFLVEMEMYLHNTPNRSDWGDDLMRWTFGNILNFTITEQFGFAIITQFRTRTNYNESNWADLNFQKRTVNRSNPQRVEFYRVAAVVTYNF